MHNVGKWPNIHLKSCCVNTTRFSKYVWPFYNIMHERVKSYASNKIEVFELLAASTKFVICEHFARCVKKLQFGQG